MQGEPGLEPKADCRKFARAKMTQAKLKLPAATMAQLSNSQGSSKRRRNKIKSRLQTVLDVRYRRPALRGISLFVPRFQKIVGSGPAETSIGQQNATGRGIATLPLQEARVRTL